MNIVRLNFRRETYEALVKHLLGSRVEEVAFVLAFPGAHEAQLDIIDLRLMQPADFEIQSAWHLELKDHVRPFVIKWAWDREAVLIEAHAHKGHHPAKFSPSDMRGFAEFVPHVLWRLPGRPYVALVFADSTYDALVWQDPSPSPLEGIFLPGQDLILPTGLTLQHLAEDSFHE